MSDSATLPSCIAHCRDRPRYRRRFASERARTGAEPIGSENLVERATSRRRWKAHQQLRQDTRKRHYGGCEFRRGVAGHLPRQDALRRRPRQRAAAFGRTGEHVGVPDDRQPRRHGPRHESGPWRPPHARPPAELLRQAVHDRPLRRSQGRRAHRLRRARTPRASAHAEDDHGGRERVSACDRLPPHRHRRQGNRREDGRGHGPHRRTGCGRAAPEPGAARRVRTTTTHKTPWRVRGRA